jgi:cellobiose phosphorylase
MQQLTVPNPSVSPDIEFLCKSRYGFFDIKAREYVISKPDTPAPWVNYITNGEYSGLVSHAGGGFSFHITPKDSRISRWRYNSMPMDRPGRYIYLRDRETGKFHSLSWQPTPSFNYKKYECRHGMNYTTIITEAQGIEAEITYFVTKENMEAWWVKIKEKEGRKRSFDVYSFVELCLGHAMVDLINQPNDKHFNDVFFNKKDEILMASKRYWVTYNSATVAQANKSWYNWAFMASTLPVEGFDASKDQFIGAWHSEENPVAVEKGISFDSEITAGDAIASLRSSLELSPGGNAEFCIFLGVVKKDGDEREHTEKAQKDASELVSKYRNMHQVKNDYNDILRKRDEYLSAFQIDVPDPEMNLFINFWNQYQTKTTFQFSRDASYHHGGLLFGRGYRDSCQDALGPLFARPDWVKQRIIEMAGRQFKDGSVYHCYYPFGGGERTGHSDTPLWLPLIVCAFLKETGNFALLDEKVKYADEGADTVLDHILNAVDFLKTKLNENNLVKIGPGDWNDTLDYCGRGGKGISSMNTFIYAFVLREISELLNIPGDERAGEYKSLYETIKESSNKHLWDGEWYIRAINDPGKKIGSSKCKEGRIFINAQSWAVISGIAEGERLKKCLESAMKYCSTPKGPKILDPPYTHVDGSIGLATRCVPGKKENGAIFNHAAAWLYLAQLKAGNAETAHSIYHQTLPVNPVIDRDRYEMEPYVYSEYVTSPDHPTYGQASHSWLTGSSVWMLRNTTDFLLGIRPEYNALCIDPCIPSQWKEFTVIRRFRGDTYNIHFKNPEGCNGGVKTISIDGKEIEGNIIIPVNDGKTHEVKVILGK